MANVNVNPFVVAGKIPEKYFCDRRDESQRLIREVTNGNNLVLISQRRMGKTGLIQFCYDNSGITGPYETFYIDILQTTSLKEFTYLLGREIFNRLAPKGVRRLKKFSASLRSISGSFGYDPISGMPQFNLQIGDMANPEITLDEIFKYLAESDTPGIIAIDEFQQITTYAEKNVEAILRSHIQHLPNTTFIFAGSERHMLQKMFAESSRPFYNSASIMTLEAIPLAEYRSFAIDLFLHRGKQLEEYAVEFVYNLFDGVTFYLQKIFNLAYSQTEAGGICSLATVKNSVTELLASYDTLYREILSNTSEQQKRLLIAIATEGKAESITSARFIHRHSLSSASSVQAAAKRLTESGMVTGIGKSYKLQDPMLRLWLLDTYTNRPLFSHDQA